MRSQDESDNWENEGKRKRYTKRMKRMLHMRRRAKRSLAARLRFKRNVKRKRREERGLPRPERTQRRLQRHQGIPFTQVKAPDILSFVRNPEGVARFISKLREAFDNKRPVWVVLTDVQEIEYDAITVLLSVVVRFKSMRIRFNGNFPRKREVRMTLNESRFFDHLYKGQFDDEDTYALSSKSSILTHAMRQVDSKLGEKIIEAASVTVWDEKRRCPGVQRTFIELMQNTNNHAVPGREGERHWWLSVKHLPERNRVAFSFVDYGVGVFYSLQNKIQGNKFYGVLERLRDKFKYSSNAEVLKLIFEGELHMTASGKPFRGKGLPGIYEALQQNKLSNFAIITNDVFFEAETGTFRVLENPFQGTFIYWELTSSNYSLPYAN